MLCSNIDGMKQRSSFWTGHHYAFLFIPDFSVNPRCLKYFTILRIILYTSFFFFNFRIILNEFQKFRYHIGDFFIVQCFSNVYKYEAFIMACSKIRNLKRNSHYK